MEDFFILEIVSTRDICLKCIFFFSEIVTVIVAVN